MNEKDRRQNHSTVQVIEGEPPTKSAPLHTVSLLGAAPDVSREQLFLGMRGICKGYVHMVGKTRVISYYEDDKVTQ